MREKLQRFMWGRYGNDQLNRFLMVVMLAGLVLSMIFRFAGPFYFIALAALIWSYFRMFSRNIAKRSAENQWYLNQSRKAKGFFRKKRKSCLRGSSFTSISVPIADRSSGCQEAGAELP